MFITIATTPENGPGFSIRAPAADLQTARPDEMTVEVLFKADGPVPVALFVVTLPPLGAAAYSADFSSPEERRFLANICRASFYDVALVRWEDEEIVMWASAPIDNPTLQGPVTVEHLLQLPVPSRAVWEKTSDEFVRALGLV